MKDLTKISWTDATLNFWEGCTKVSPGCKNCYAETRDRRFHDGEHWGKGRKRKKSLSAFDKLRTQDKAADQGKFVECQNCGARRFLPGDCSCGCGPVRPVRLTTFVMSLGDFFDVEVPSAWRLQGLEAMLDAKATDFMILTKRPEEVIAALLELATMADEKRRLQILDWVDGRPPLNIAIGTSIENADVASDRLAALVKIPATLRFVSAEPLIGRWGAELASFAGDIDLVIAGGESGAAARAICPAWIDYLEAICDTVGIPFHFKQWGEWIPQRVAAVDWKKPVTGNVLVWNPETDCAEPYRARGANAQGWEVVHRLGKKKALELDVMDSLDALGRTRTERLIFPMEASMVKLFRLEGIGAPTRRMTFRAAMEFRRRDDVDGPRRKVTYPPATQLKITPCD